MSTLNALELRARISQICNAAITGGVDPFEVAMVMDSVKADLLMQVPYRALAEMREQNTEETEEEADV